MKNLTHITIAFLAVSLTCAAPAPYPVVVDSQADTAASVTAYRGNESTYRVSFKDGGAASDITGLTPFFSVFTNNLSSVYSTGTVSVVSWTNGVVDFTFSPEAIAWLASKSWYQAGVWLTNGNPRVYNEGVFTVYGSPSGQ